MVGLGVLGMKEIVAVMRGEITRMTLEEKTGGQNKDMITKIESRIVEGMHVVGMSKSIVGSMEENEVNMKSLERLLVCDIVPHLWSFISKVFFHCSSSLPFMDTEEKKRNGMNLVFKDCKT